MCQTYAVREHTVPTCSLVISYLSSPAGASKGQHYFWHWRSKERAVPSSAGTCLGQRFICKSILLAAIFLLLERMPNSAGVRVASIAYFGCLLITRICRSATHCYIHRLETDPIFAEQSLNYSLIGAPCACQPSPGVKGSYFLVSRVAWCRSFIFIALTGIFKSLKRSWAWEGREAVRALSCYRCDVKVHQQTSGIKMPHPISSHLAVVLNKKMKTLFKSKGLLICLMKASRRISGLDLQSIEKSIFVDLMHARCPNLWRQEL